MPRTPRRTHRPRRYAWLLAAVAGPAVGAAPVPHGGIPVIAVTTTTPSTTLVPGGTITFTAVVQNTSALALVNATLANPIGPGFASATWTCAGSGGATCPTASGSGPIRHIVPVIPAGAALTYTIVATVLADPPATVLDTFTAAPPANGSAVCASGQAPPCSASASVPTAPVVEIFKTTSTTSATPGGTANYVIRVNNIGPTAAGGTVVADPLPAGVAAFAWTCTASGGAVCPAATGSVAIGETIATLPPGGSVDYAVVATLAGTLPSTLVNAATATPPAGGVCSDGAPPPCYATATTGPVPIVQVTKTVGTGPLTPGATVTYQVVVANEGAGAASTAVSDPIPPGLTTPFTWTCATTGGIGACSVPSGSGAIATTANLPAPGDAVTYTIVATVGASPPATITNAATLTPTGGVCNGPCTATASRDAGATATLAITKDDGASTYQPGGGATYTIVATNGGPSAAADVAIADPLPAGATLAAPVACVAAGTATCGTITGAVGATSVAIAGATIAAGAGNSVTYTVAVGFAATMTQNPLVNTVTATDPGDADGATASDSNARAAAADLSIGKSGPPNVAGGAPVTYTLTIANAGPSSADGATYLDDVPAGVTGVAASCGNAQNGATCATPSVAGNAVSGAVPTLPPGGSVEITITGTAPSGTQTLVNTAGVTPPAGTTDPVDDNDSATATTTTPVTLQAFDVD